MTVLGLQRRLLFQHPPSWISLSLSSYRRRLPSSTASGGSSCYFSNNKKTNPPHPHHTDRLRIAVVGGGVTGLTTALHLAPLVAQGWIAGPIDVYQQHTPTPNRRSIGVGLWSTALDPLQESSRPSHQLVYQDLTKRHGSWIDRVGYRTPQGDWLATSQLMNDDNDENEDKESSALPHLLFVPERDLIDTLYKAVHLEQAAGTIALHSKATVLSMDTESPHRTLTTTGSAPLLLQGVDNDNSVIRTERDYHLVVSAEGLSSKLRHYYSGHDLRRPRLTGTNALSSPIELPSSNQDTTNNSSPNNVNTTLADFINPSEKIKVQDRGYTVFRGNAHVNLASSSNNKDNNNNHNEYDDAATTSFQTWGEGQSKRFATVPMPDATTTGSSGTEERHVWFATIDDVDGSLAASDPIHRQAQLIKAFSDWHDPIVKIIQATPPDEILMERAVSHKHCMGPVLIRDPYGNYGPSLVFLGDAFMTVDPILAQGFTLGMEGAAVLAASVQKVAQQHHHHDGTTTNTTTTIAQLLAKELQQRHDQRLHRLICLLRATEIVQALGQPTSGTFWGMLSRDVLRPLMKLTPASIKTPIFNWMMKYSLGLHRRRQQQQKKKQNGDEKEEKKESQ